jgi:hypothetical protein
VDDPLYDDERPRRGELPWLRVQLNRRASGNSGGNQGGCGGWFDGNRWGLRGRRQGGGRELLFRFFCPSATQAEAVCERRRGALRLALEFVIIVTHPSGDDWTTFRCLVGDIDVGFVQSFSCETDRR